MRSEQNAASVAQSKLRGIVKKPDKFSGFSLWLSIHNQVLCPNVRDVFTAGGQKEYGISGVRFRNLPKILQVFLSNIDNIVELLHTTDIAFFNELWKMELISKEALYSIWIKKTVVSIAQIYNFDSFNLESWLEKKLKS